MHTKIKDIHISKNGKVSDKWESYLDFYDELFSSQKDQPISLLEIGIQNGGSLETYAQYFKNAENIVGCDINENCSKLKYENKCVSIVIGNANSDESHQIINNICSNYDFIIDDGSHFSIDILNSFIRYFPHLKPGGKFVIEDCHALYFHNFGGGVLNKFSAMYFFKNIIDVINFEWWGDKVSLNEFLSTYFSNGIPNFINEGWIDKIEFRNSIITITKARKPGHNKLGERIITGKEYIINI